MQRFLVTGLESAVALLRLAFLQSKWTLRMAVLWCRHSHTIIVILVTLVQQFRQAAAAAKVDVELVEQSTVKEFMLFCHWW